MNIKRLLPQSLLRFWRFWQCWRFAFLRFRKENTAKAKTRNAVQSQSTDTEVKTDENKTGGTDKNTDKTGGAKSAESPLKEGESLEKLVDDFNTLPDGEEKEKVRKRLEEILAEAEKQSPANSANQEDNNGKDQ